MVIFLRGGLGNQLFQIALGERMRVLNGVQVSYSDLFLKKNALTNTRSLWPNYSLKLGLQQIYFGHLRNFFMRYGISIFRLLQTLNFLPREFLNIKISNSGIEESDLLGVTYLDAPGAKVVEEKDVEILRQIFVRACPNIQVDNYLLGSIHIRLGDYKKHAHIYGMPDREYLRKALERLTKEKERDSISSIAIFTDDEVGRAGF